MNSIPCKSSNNTQNNKPTFSKLVSDPHTITTVSKSNMSVKKHSTKKDEVPVFLQKVRGVLAMFVVLLFGYVCSRIVSPLEYVNGYSCRAVGCRQYSCCCCVFTCFLCGHTPLSNNITDRMNIII